MASLQCIDGQRVITVDDAVVRVVRSCKHLGTIHTATGNMTEEATARVHAMMVVFRALADAFLALRSCHSGPNCGWRTRCCGLPSLCHGDLECVHAYNVEVLQHGLYVGFLAIWKTEFIATFPDRVKPLRIREGVSASILKRVSLLWTHRSLMNCAIIFSIFEVKMSYQLHKTFRDSRLQSTSFDITMGRNIIPLPFVNWSKIFGMVAHQISIAIPAVPHEILQCLYDPLIHAFLESNLDHCIVTLPRSGLSLWI